jgi:hypothetical protein
MTVSYCAELNMSLKTVKTCSHQLFPRAPTYYVAKLLERGWVWATRMQAVVPSPALLIETAVWVWENGLGTRGWSQDQGRYR